MNLLKKYIKLKGITAVQISEATGLGYHCVDKTLKGLRKGHVPRTKIASYLDIPYEQVWGSRSSKYIFKLIEKEIQHSADSAREQKIRVLKRRFLDCDYQVNARVANI
ncbi:MAG: hypothetical protein PHG51_04705 [Candidatus Omnitrophica bacterium]|jgi:lambda repressor-like predicted transcriptional regulator|nr:hypothetical protein [Candidatus Omnitrophota bacterium]